MEPRTLDVKTLEGLARQGEIDTVVTAFPDMFGRLMGKRITAHFFLEEIVEEGMHACDYLLADDIEMDPVQGYRFASWQSGYGDVRAVPDLVTLRRVPWLEKTALVLCDLVDEEGGHPVTVAPRAILRRQMDRIKAAGIIPMGGSELEFFLFRDSYEEARAKRYQDLRPYGWYIEDYHILQGTREEWFVRAVRNAMDDAGVPVEFSKGEWGPGQHEVNLRYADFLEMADRHTIYKNGVKEMAMAKGVAVTFMAKWNERLAGSSFHLHASLWDLDRRSNLLYDPALPQGMSDRFRWFLGGQMAHARELALFFAPFVNSYKRYQAGSFAPNKNVWSPDNRTAGFRIIGHGKSLRVENRMPGADANPYLAYAATIAAGLDGLERRIEPPEMFTGDAYTTPGVPTIPYSLREAIPEFERSEFVREAFGDEVVEHYLHMAHTEQQKFDQVVTDWELLRHFERT